MKMIAPLLLVLTLVPLASCAPKVNDPADVQAVTQTMEDYFKASSINDTAASVAMTTDRTILFEPHMTPLVGKEAIGKLHQAFLDQFAIDAKGPVTGVRVFSDAAIESLVGEVSSSSV